MLRLLLLNSIIFWVCCKTSTNHETMYGFSTCMYGPFNYPDILKDNQVFNRNFTPFLEARDSDFYIVEVANNGIYPLFIKTDLSSGMLLNRCRYYAPSGPDQFRIESDFPIVDNGPVYIDTLIPGAKKDYYTVIVAPECRVIELNFGISSHIIDSLNVRETKALQNRRIQVVHPFFMYDVDKGKLVRRNQAQSIHSRVVW